MLLIHVKVINVFIPPGENYDLNFIVRASLSKVWQIYIFILVELLCANLYVAVHSATMRSTIYYFII